MRVPSVGLARATSTIARPIVPVAGCLVAVGLLFGSGRSPAG
jgi:hypothetical protein